MAQSHNLLVSMIEVGGIMFVLDSNNLSAVSGGVFCSNVSSYGLSIEMINELDQAAWNEASFVGTAVGLLGAAVTAVAATTPPGVAIGLLSSFSAGLGAAIYDFQNSDIRWYIA